MTTRPAPDPRAVAVALSGGVDSSVAAALLLDLGFQVAGVTLHLASHVPQDRSPTVAAARRACATLGIDHHVVSAADLFDRCVLRPCWEAYAAGATPNPCAMCNPLVKFMILARTADALGCAHLATGHYARVHRDATGRCTLVRALDRDKDQTYFMYGLGRDVLDRLLLPLGRLRKDRVRALARARGLPAAERPESQDACWNPDPGVPFSESLRRRFGAAAPTGPLLDPEGRRLGEHRGIHRYTVGQRRGLGVALGRRAHVLRIDASTREVVVTTDPGALACAGLCLVGVTWAIPRPRTRLPLAGAVKVQFRHNSSPRPAHVVPLPDGRARVRFSQPVGAVAPGQVAVIYDGDRLLGGGRIHRTEACPEPVKK